MDFESLEIKAEIKAISEDAGRGKITGYGSVFGVLDSHGDIVEKGAFAKSIAENGMPIMLLQHDKIEVGGVWTEASEDEYGLKLTGELNLEVQKAREYYALAKQGAIKGLSIGYRVKNGYVDKANGIRHLTELELAEVSLVTFPANRAAKITGVKTADVISKRQLEDNLRDAGKSRNEAKAIVALAFGTTEPEQRDVANDEVIAGLKKAINILTGEKDGNRNQGIGE